jgi:hypothetical protein
MKTGFKIGFDISDPWAVFCLIVIAFIVIAAGAAPAPRAPTVRVPNRSTGPAIIIPGTDIRTPKARTI